MQWPSVVRPSSSAKQPEDPLACTGEPERARQLVQLGRTHCGLGTCMKALDEAVKLHGVQALASATLQPVAAAARGEKVEICAPAPSTRRPLSSKSVNAKSSTGSARKTRRSARLAAAPSAAASTAADEDDDTIVFNFSRTRRRGRRRSPEPDSTPSTEPAAAPAPSSTAAAAVPPTAEQSRTTEAAGARQRPSFRKYGGALRVPASRSGRKSLMPGALPPLSPVQEDGGSASGEEGESAKTQTKQGNASKPKAFVMPAYMKEWKPLSHRAKLSASGRLSAEELPSAAGSGGATGSRRRGGSGGLAAPPLAPPTSVPDSTPHRHSAGEATPVSAGVQGSQKAGTSLGGSRRGRDAESVADEGVAKATRTAKAQTSPSASESTKGSSHSGETRSPPATAARQETAADEDGDSTLESPVITFKPRSVALLGTHTAKAPSPQTAAPDAPSVGGSDGGTIEFQPRARKAGRRSEGQSAPVATAQPSQLDADAEADTVVEGAGGSTQGSAPQAPASASAAHTQASTACVHSHTAGVGAEASGNPFAALLSDRSLVTVNGMPYVRLEVIGRGGSSKVFRVLGPDLQVYALKRVKLGRGDSGSLASFANEIALLRRLAGKANIIRLVDAEVNAPRKTIHVVMEAGEIDLSKLLARERSAAADGSSGARPPLAGRIGDLDGNFLRLTWRQMLEAVGTIHAERIVHGDLKPANFVFVAGTLKLIDFGIAKAISTNTTNIYRESQVGTLNYMSPEAILDTSGSVGGGRGGRSARMRLGRASDVWSMGCILYQMVYGRTPFAHLSLVQKLHSITDPTYEVDFPPTGQPALDAVLAACLTRDPAARPSIEQLLQHEFLAPGVSAPAASPHLPAQGPSASDLMEALAQPAALSSLDQLAEPDCRAQVLAALAEGGPTAAATVLVRSAESSAAAGQNKKPASAAQTPAAPRLPSALASGIKLGSSRLRKAAPQAKPTKQDDGSDLESVLRRGLAKRFAALHGDDESATDEGEFTFTTVH